MRAAAVAALLLGAAACGADEAPPPSTVAAADAPFCEAFGDLVDGPLAEGGFDTGDPELVRAAVESTREIVARLRSSAPATVAAEATAVADAFEGMFAVVERYDYDLARVRSEATPEEVAAFDAVGRAPAGPGAEDPYQVLVDLFGERCSAGVTIPDDLLPADQP
jgi:hypothetical protein